MSYKLLDNIDNITPISYKHNYNNINDSIQRIFPESDFITKKNKSPLNGNLKFTIRDKSQKFCIIFIIEKDLIYVDELLKCSSGSGTTLLHKVEQFAREIGIFKITLIDKSKIITPCDEDQVSLQMLSILTTGESWYNKLGYIYENQDEINSHNSSIIQMRFSDFIKIIEQQFKSKLFLPSMNHSKFNELIENIKSIGILDFESTVQEVFIKIKEMFKKGQPCLADIEPHLVLLIGYIKMSNILLLPPNRQIFTKILQPDIARGGTHRKKQKRTTKKQKRTTKRTKTNKFLRKKLR